MPQIVNFNVGGTKYSTYVSTIVDYPQETTLSVLINQDNEKRLIDEGKEIFIDRNGTMFEYILDYIRSVNMGTKMILPKDELTLSRLSVEAKYYQLIDLERLIISQNAVHLIVGPIPGLGDVPERFAAVISDLSRSPVLKKVVDKYTSKIRHDQFSHDGRKTDVYIDRDGQYFGYILDYLRNGDDMIMPEDKRLLNKLIQEAEFFELPDLQNLFLVEKQKRGNIASM